MNRLSRQIQTYTKAQYAIAAAAVLAAGLFYAAIYRPQSADLTRLSADVSAKRAELASDRSQTRRLPKVTSDLDSLKKRLAGFKTLPSDPQLGQFISDITDASQRLALRNRVEEPGVPRRDALYSEQPITLSFSGNFSSVWSFVRQLEDMERLTRVRDLTIDCVDDKAGTVNVTLSVNIYYAAG